MANNLDENITKVEWHIMEGIDEKALEFIKKIAQDKKVIDKIKIVLYK